MLTPEQEPSKKSSQQAPPRHLKHSWYLSEEAQLEREGFIEVTVKTPEFRFAHDDLRNLHLPKGIYLAMLEHTGHISQLERLLDGGTHFRGVGPRKIEVIKRSLAKWRQLRGPSSVAQQGDY